MASAQKQGVEPRSVRAEPLNVGLPRFAYPGQCEGAAGARHTPRVERTPRAGKARQLVSERPSVRIHARALIPEGLLTRAL